MCEVGLGGRLDATNVLEPVVTAITSIGLDHQQYLGHSLAEIAREKAGIIKRGVPVVVGRARARSAAACVERALAGRACNAPVIRTERTDALLDAYAPVRLALGGAHQVANAVVAVRCSRNSTGRASPFRRRPIRTGLEQVDWPGRLELRRLADGREVLLDAAHNADGAAALRGYLPATPPRPLVFAAMRDKDLRTMIETLAPVVSAFVHDGASNARSADPAMLAELARDADPRVAVAVEPASARRSRTHGASRRESSSPDRFFCSATS